MTGTSHMTEGGSMETHMRERGETARSSEACRYVAVIGDVKQSRDALDRRGLQETLELALAGVNETLRDELASDFVVTLGDEFQGLLKSPVSIMRVLIALEARLDGTPMRYGVGWGTLATDLREQAIGMDGPCFHRAREAVTEGKRADRWVTVSSFGGDDEILNGLLWLMGAVRGRWTSVQRETVEQVRTARTQREAAAARGVHESSVSQALKAALHEPVLAAEHAVSAILKRYESADSTWQRSSPRDAPGRVAR